jgi:hypothetical protein
MTWKAKAAADQIVQANRVVAITASSTAFTATDAIHCNEAGSLTVDFANGATGVTLVVLSGVMYPYRIVKVTAGTGVLALYN